MNDNPSSDASATAKVRESVSHAVDKTRESVSQATRKTQEGIEANPMSVLLGGLAVGVVAGALIPATQREKKALGTIGKRITETAAAAAVAARDTAKQELGAITPDKDSARNKAGSIIETVLGAAKEAGKSAASTKNTA